jgi:ribosomal protein S18 acetylase RimI-like enzyme
MISATAKAITRLVDKAASGLTVPADLSHLVDVRPLRSYEVDIVAAQLNAARNAATHRSRLKLQEDGVLVYLIAWIGDTPVGHGMLLWEGPTGTPKQHIDRACPYVEDLWVRNDLRSKGVGARMLAEMTMLAIAHGYDAVSLSVGVENRRAIRLYKRLGFATAPIPRFTLSGMVAMANGETQFWSEKCQYMLKSLDFSKDREVEIA